VADAAIPIRIFVCAGIRLYREGLAYVLANVDGLHVVGTASNTAEATRVLPTLDVGVLLVDLPATESFLALPRLRAAAPEAKVLAIAVPEVVDEVLTRAEAGIEGYITRDASIDDLVRAVESIHRDELICNANIAAALLRHVGRLAAGRAPSAASGTLTPRQRQIAVLLGDGLSNKEIARALSIETTTVKNHVHTILEKLKVERRSDVARLLTGY
jgi:two-component system, NarL family, nitrate/nitrite response regulator NarL